MGAGGLKQKEDKIDTLMYACSVEEQSQINNLSSPTATALKGNIKAVTTSASHFPSAFPSHTELTHWRVT